MGSWGEKYQNSGGTLYAYKISTGKPAGKRKLDRRGINMLIIIT
jgi:hypothetical protein